MRIVSGFITTASGVCESLQFFTVLIWMCPVKGFLLIKFGFDSVKHLRVQKDGLYCIIN